MNWTRESARDAFVHFNVWGVKDDICEPILVIIVSDNPILKGFPSMTCGTIAPF